MEKKKKKEKESQGTVKLTQLCRKGSKVKLGSNRGKNIKILYSGQGGTAGETVQFQRKILSPKSYEITLVFEFVLVAWQVSTVVKE